MRRLVWIAAMLCALSLSAADRQYTVVIDAGHGGKDAGAVGRSMKVQEKHLNLDVALRLASKLRTAYPEIKVVLTRDKDVFLPLQERADIVNRNNADLFICIHTNAAENRSACGAETFILGTDKMEQNLDVAMRENAVMKLEADYQTAYQGFDPNSIDSYIMFELMQNQYMDQSLQFATNVQTQFANALKRDDRGVRQAAFWVLLKSACPSVLVEMGFVSNAEEEKYLASDKGKREITESLFTAFSNYYERVTGYKSGTSEVQESIAKDDEQVTNTPSETTQSAPAETTQTVPAETTQSAPVETTQPVPVETTQPAPVEVKWGVQIFVSRTKLPESDWNFHGLKGCTYKVAANGLYKYIYGSCATKEEAQQLQKQIKDKFPDCFVVKME